MLACMSKDDRLHFRLDPVAREKLRKVCAVTGLDEPTALRACISAFIEYVEAHGEITLPLRVVPRAKEKAAIPTPTFPSTARAPHGATLSLNEEPAKRDAVPPTRTNTPAQPDITKTRRGIRGMIAKEKGKL